MVYKTTRRFCRFGGYWLTMTARLIRYLPVILALGWIVPIPANLRAADRPPVWAGKFYPAEKETLAETIAHLTRKAQADHPQLPTSRHLKALILPHAGYAYSGGVAAYAWHVLHGARYAKVVLMGPDHRVGFRDAAVSEADAWTTPLGRIPLHPDGRKLCQMNREFRPIPASDAGEHSLEVILPFLQTYLPGFQLVPLVLGPCDYRQTARTIDPLLDAATLLVVSTDLSHYLPYAQAVGRDKTTIAAILAMDQKAVLAAENSACGKYPVAVLLDLARRHGWQPVLLHYANSGDATEDHRQVVGYAAIAFYGEKTMSSFPASQSTLSEEQGQALVALARDTLLQHFKRSIAPDHQAQIQAALADPALQAPCGTFVTLKIGSQLRGCIGSLVGRQPLVEGIRTNALNAALHDPRFRPLTSKELDRVSIEISILTAPQPLDYADADELTARLRPHVDGVTIRKGFASATFLPQVWEQLPEVGSFLFHLCEKAGLPGDAWRQGDLEVETYQVQHFEEDR
jgi:AmmeMemoRadiSam system protein B/AmmeMemoRadiSam system protein A